MRYTKIAAGLFLALSLAALTVLLGVGLAKDRDLVSAIAHLFDSTLVAQGEQPPTESISWARVSWVADIEDLRLNESSGLAASHLHADTIWSINDSGSEALLFALDRDGRTVSMQIVDTELNTDWESLSSFVMDGIAYLAIGDTGDNFRWRRDSQFLIVREPQELDSEDNLDVAWTVNFTYPGGPRDSEASAVDVANNRILVLTKRRYPPELFSIPLTPQVTDPEALLLGTLAHLPLPTEDELEIDPLARFRHMPSGMDLKHDMLLVTTYKHAYLYDVNDLSAVPSLIPLPSLGQREAIAFAGKTTLPTETHVAYISKERYGGTGVADLFQLEFRAPLQGRERH